MSHGEKRGEEERKQGQKGVTQGLGSFDSPRVRVEFCGRNKACQQKEKKKNQPARVES